MTRKELYENRLQKDYFSDDYIRFEESAKTVYTCFFHLSRIKIGIAQLILNCKQKTIQEIALEWLEIIVVCSVIIATNISKIRIFTNDFAPVLDRHKSGFVDNLFPSSL